MSIVPRLNVDNKPHIPGFIMEMDKVNLQNITDLRLNMKQKIEIFKYINNTNKTLKIFLKKRSKSIYFKLRMIIRVHKYFIIFKQEKIINIFKIFDL